jgi:hypothetical protein
MELPTTKGQPITISRLISLLNSFKHVYGDIPVAIGLKDIREPNVFSIAANMPVKLATFSHTSKHVWNGLKCPIVAINTDMSYWQDVNEISGAIKGLIDYKLADPAYKSISQRMSHANAYDLDHYSPILEANNYKPYSGPTSKKSVTFSQQTYPYIYNYSQSKINLGKQEEIDNGQGYDDDFYDLSDYRE